MIAGHCVYLYSQRTFSATLNPAEAYGERNEERVQRVPIKHLVYSGKLKAGARVELNTAQGRRPVTVIKAGRHSANVDTNHPLAGQDLTFALELVDIA